MKQRLDQLEKDRRILMVGQLGFEVEKAIVRKVLANHTIPRFEKYYGMYKIKLMEKALGGDKEYNAMFNAWNGLSIERNRSNAKATWDKLKTELQWTTKPYNGYIRTVKELRTGTAHPNFDIEEVQRIIDEGSIRKVADSKEVFEGVVQLYRHVNKTRL